MDYEEKQAVAIAMIKHGGGFVKKLGETLLHADVINASKIHETWPEYWQQYLEHSLKDEKSLSQD